MQGERRRRAPFASPGHSLLSGVSGGVAIVAILAMLAILAILEDHAGVGALKSAHTAYLTAAYDILCANMQRLGARRPRVSTAALYDF